MNKGKTLKLRKGMTRRLFAAFVSMCVLISSANLTVFAADGAESNYTTAADSSTAMTYEGMLGTDVDGNRYAGRVWADKSVYTDDSVKLDENTVSKNTETKDEDFMVVYSALGSSTAVSTETRNSGKLDVVLILDISASMGRYVDNAKTTRLESVVASANGLINNILSSNDNRIAVVTYGIESETLLDLAHYDYKSGQTNILSVSQSRKPNADNSGGVQVNEGDATITATTTTVTTNPLDCYYRGTNLQSGIDEGMGILADQNAEDVADRTPVVIVLTDGVADYAVSQNWWNYSQNNAVMPVSNEITAGVALSTLLNASYMKSAINKKYDEDAIVYGVSVDLEEDSDAYVVMNPAEVFKASGSTNVAESAYGTYQSWVNATAAVRLTENRYTWTFGQLSNPDTTYGVTKDEVISNINYVDTHYSVTSAELSGIFDEIYAEISEPAFHPITDTVVSGGYDVSVPLTYVDFIGEYMEVKDFKAVTLFDKTYDVTAGTSEHVDSVNESGTITRTTTTTYNVGVNTETITHPVMGTTFNISDAVTIKLVDECEGYIDENDAFVKTSVSLQELWIYIQEEALPIILDTVDVNIDEDGNTTTTFTETTADPIRVYYTVGVSKGIKDTEGNVDLSLVDADYITANTKNGKVEFYSNRYGNMNTADDITVNQDNEAVAGKNGLVDKGDAHVSFTPSEENRYYYHQKNYPIFGSVLDTDGTAFTKADLDKGEWGILYHEYGVTKDYTLNWLKFSEAKLVPENVFTVVGFYREDTSTTTEDDGDAVAYLAFSSWEELRYSTVFAYVADTNNAEPVYLNYENGAIVEGTAGYAVAEEERAAYLAEVESYVADKEGWSLDNVYAYLAIDSQRITRLHNMTNLKSENETNTADYSYAPEYNNDPTHVGGVVIWLGNNGVLRVTPDEPDTGLQISKEVTETITGAGDTFEFTIQSSDERESKTYNAVLYAADGSESVTTITFANGSATVELKDGESIYLSGMTAGTTYTVTEKANDYYNVQSVTVDDVAGNSATLVEGHIAQVKVVNEPKEYGNLIIAKEVNHTMGTEYEVPLTLSFDIKVDLGEAAADKEFEIAYSQGGAATEKLQADVNGVLTVTLKNGQEVIIYNLEEGTKAVVTEPNPGAGFKVSYWVNGTEGTSAEVTIVANETQWVEVENIYDPTYTSLTPNVTLSGDKTFNGTTWTDEEFKIFLQRYDEANSTWQTIDTAIVNASTKAFTFDLRNTDVPQSFTEPGTYYYQVVEENHGQTIDGITYDATMHTFDVIVADVGMNQTLQITNVVSTHTGTGGFEYDSTNAVWTNTEVDFVNSYSATDTSVTINILKDIDNQANSSLASKAGYNFGMYEDGVLDTTWETDQTDDVGETMITRMYTYDEVKDVLVNNKATYTYTLKEIVPSPANSWIGYSTVEHTVVVTVTNADGKLSATYTIDGNDVDTAKFTNVYKPTGSLVLEATKVLKAETRTLNDEEFKFEVKWTLFQGPEDTQATAKNDIVADGKNGEGNNSVDTVIFDAINYTEVGTYWYDVYEVKETLGGMTYDETVHRVRVIVSDNGKGTLVTDVLVLDDIDDEIIFNNSYTPDPTDVQIAATKELSGRAEALSEGEFIFRLLEVEENGTVVTDGTRLYAANAADGKVQFAKITYDEAGTYYYQVQEYNAGANGYTYDTTVHTYKVVVEDNLQGQLVAKVYLLTGSTYVETTSGATFTNTYKASGATVVHGIKELIGKDLIGDDFQFEIYASDENGTIAQGESPIEVVSNDKHGNFVFDIAFENLTFAQEEIKSYYYVVKEAKGNLDYITYDETQYLVKVTVTDNGDGTVSATPSVTIKGSNNGDSVLAFFNVYNTPDILIEKTQVIGENKTIDDATAENLVVEAGDIVTYYLAVKNNGEGYAKDVVVTDAIPEGLTLVENSISDNGTVKEGVITWEIGSLSAETSVMVSFSVSVPEVDKNTTWTNVGTVKYNNPGEVTPNEEESNKVEIEEYVPKVSVVKAQAVNGGSATTEKQTVKAGDKITYHITVTNSGKVAATGLTISDKLPAGLTVAAGTISNSGTEKDGTITWTIDSLAAGASVTVSFTVTVPEVEKDTTWNNIATVAYENDTDDKDETSNEVTVEWKVPSAPVTGDNNSVAMWSTLAFASLIMCGVMLIIDKKRKNEF